MTPELLGDAALLVSEGARGLVEGLLGAIMIFIRKKVESREVRPLSLRGLFNEIRTPFFQWRFLGSSLGALRRYSKNHCHSGEGPKEAKSENYCVYEGPHAKIRHSSILKISWIWSLWRKTLRGAILYILGSGHRLVMIIIIVILGKGRRKEIRGLRETSS